MVSNPQILLVSHLPELHYSDLLMKGGFRVANATDLEEGLTLWRPFQFDLVLIVVDHDRLEAPLAFCEEVKKLDPNQNVAFVTGWHTYVPPSSCPDEVIHQEFNPALFIRKVTELSQIR